jgi:TonB family protein
MLWSNLLAYGVQVLALVAAGALLPMLFRVRQPRTQLVYYQVLLTACLLLPVVQPWPKPLVIVQESAPAAASASTPTPAPAGTPAQPAIQWEQVVWRVLVGGAILRGLWLLAGLWQLRRYRMGAIPLDPLPAAVESARARCGAEAAVCTTGAVDGPVTFGVLRPIILLPPAILEQPYEAQFGIACHELLHVRRRDWLFTICEECAGALLWFHPAVWWLLGQIRLTREQAVDSAVVSLTGARDPYVSTLLTLAGAGLPLDLAPAPLFLRKRHLANRIHSLVKKEVAMSKQRLVVSYLSIAAVLIVTAWLVMAPFPLQGNPQVEVQQGAVRDGAGVTVEPGGRILHRTPVSYPARAASKRVEGVVTVEMTLDSQGTMSDARVMSGPDELRRGVLASVLQWHYILEASQPPSVMATIEFRLPPEVVTPAPEPINTAPGLWPGAGPGMGPGPATAPEVKPTLTRIDVSTLPRPLQDMMRSKLASFQGQLFSNELMDKIRSAAREVDEHAGLVWRPDPGTGNVLVAITLSGSSLSLPTQIPEASASPQPNFPSTPGVQRIPVGGNVQPAKLISQPVPEYPPLARQARIQGTVRFNVLIGADGRVIEITLVSGHPLLMQAATAAVKGYVYQPTLLNGQPVEVVTQVDVNFTINEQ